MGLFTTPPQTSPPPPTPSPDGAFEAPNRDRRAHCWQARDAFFACLDKHQIVDSIKNKDAAEKMCGEEGKGLERECASSWVSRWGFFCFGSEGGLWFGGEGEVSGKKCADVCEGLGDVFQAAKSNGVQQEANAGAAKGGGSKGGAGRYCAAGIATEAVVMLEFWGSRKRVRSGKSDRRWCYLGALSRSASTMYIMHWNMEFRKS